MQATGHSDDRIVVVAGAGEHQILGSDPFGSGSAEVGGVEPGLEKLDDQAQRLAARFLDLEGQTSQWLGKLVVGAA